MRLHMHNRNHNSHFDFMLRAKFDVVQMFTPPKSKSPWEAATSGSTGGWASFAGPSTTTNPNDPAGWGWVGPALTAASGAIPMFGPLLASGMGAAGAAGGGTGFQGTDKGWSNLISTPLGAVAGYGLGGIGAGVGQAAKTALGMGAAGAGGGLGQTGASTSLMGKLGTGFKEGLDRYLGTNIIPTQNWSSGKAIGNWASGLLGGGGGSTPAATTGASGGTTGANILSSGVSSQYGGGISNVIPGTEQFGAGVMEKLAAGGSLNPMDYAQLAGGGTITKTAIEQAKSGAGGGFTAILDFLKKPESILGAVGLGASAMFKNPTPPEIGPIMKQYLGPANLSDIERKAREELGKSMTLRNPEEYLTDAYFDEAQRQIDKTYDQAIKDTEKRYAAYGMRYSGQSLEEIRKLNEERAHTKALARNEALDRRYTLAEQERFQAIIHGLNLDEQEMMEMMYGDIYDVSAKYQAEVADVMALREIAATAGMYGLKGALGAFNTTG